MMPTARGLETGSTGYVDPDPERQKIQKKDNSRFLWDCKLFEFLVIENRDLDPELMTTELEHCLQLTIVQETYLNLYIKKNLQK
jgi:hypothetical protein